MSAPLRLDTPSDIGAPGLLTGATPTAATPGTTPTATMPTPAMPTDAERPVGDRRARRAPWLLLGIAIALVLGVVWVAASGQYPISPGQVLAGIGRAIVGTAADDDATRMADATLWTVRFPRAVIALLVGAALAVGGALMQGVFGNPLAEPGVVGVSSGAAAAACVVIVLGLNVLGPWTLVVGAFFGGLAATAVVYGTARQGGRTEVVTLVLTGIAVNAVGGAIIALMTFLGDNASREEIIFWQLGSLNGSRWVHVAVIEPVVVLGLAAIGPVARPLDLLALGEKPARHLGVDVESPTRTFPSDC